MLTCLVVDSITNLDDDMLVEDDGKNKDNDDMFGYGGKEKKLLWSWLVMERRQTKKIKKRSRYSIDRFVCEFGRERIDTLFLAQWA